VSGTSCGWGGDGGKFPRIEPVKHAGHSAISLVFAVLSVCMSYEKEYAAQIKNAHKMLQAFSEFVPPCEGTRVSVPEAVVEIWESALRDERRTDVELHVSGAESLRAHSLVLASASVVLEASLASPMREGQTGVIQVDGVSLDSLRLVLQLIYSGTICDEPGVATLLGALDLAHRWQVGHVVLMAERALANSVAPDNIAELCEAALLKDLPVLRAACRSLVGASSEVQAALERGDFPPAVLRELQGVQVRSASTGSAVLSGTARPSGGTPPQKRRRTL